MDKKEIQVGWLVLDKDTEFTNSFETAAWYENVMVKAGKYPITVSREGLFTGREPLYAHLPGVITSDNFQSLFCGSPIGQPYDTSKNAGKESAYTCRFDNYALAYFVLEPEKRPFAKYAIELLPEFRAVYVDFTTIEGEPCQTARVMYAEKEHEKACAEFLTHPNSEVRCKVAQYGYGLDTLVHDRESNVRWNVAAQGYGLDLLAQDNSKSVCDAVRNFLMRHDTTLAEWIKGNPDKCALPENQRKDLDDVISDCANIAAKQAKPDKTDKQRDLETL